MAILSPNKIKKLKERLYKQKVSGLLVQGTKGLSPLEQHKTDAKGRPLVHAQIIIRFFLDEMARAGDFFPDEYVEALYALFREFSMEAEAVSFVCGFSVPLEKILAADSKTAIELLSTNIIITYFNSFKTCKGTVDNALLSPDLSKIIIGSNAGRNYNELVNKTLDGLAQSLNQDRSWRHDLDEISNAGLICRLTGSSLPPMAEEAKARTLKKSHKEMAACNELFTKIMTARAKVFVHGKNKRKYLQLMGSLDAAILTILKKTDAYLAAAHRLMGLVGLSYPIVLGETHDALRQNLTWLFLNTKPGKDGRTDILKNLGLAQLRYRLNMLFNYPDITRFAATFQNAPVYSPIYFDIFRLLFKTAVEQLEMGEADMASIERTIRDLARAAEKLDLPEERLKNEKQALQTAYVSLILKIDIEQLEPLINFCDLICRATRDRTRHIMVDVRSALIAACYTGICRQAAEDPSPRKTGTIIKKYLSEYAGHYKPQRDFYRIFFDTHVCAGAQPAEPMAQLIKSGKAVAAALLTTFSDETAMKDLISGDRICGAASVLKDIMQKKSLYG